MSRCVGTIMRFMIYEKISCMPLACHALFPCMSRTPNDEHLNGLANRLAQIAFRDDRPSIGPAKYVHAVSGRFRVTRPIRGKLIALGWTADESCASFFADCLTECLWPYYGEGKPPDTEFNEQSAESRIAKREANLAIVALAEQIVSYLSEKFSFPSRASLFHSRKITKEICSDLEAKVKSAQIELRKAQHSLSKLYTL